jgi:hypothetical protein
MAAEAMQADFARCIVAVQPEQESAERVQLDVGGIREIDHPPASARVQRERQVARGLAVESTPDLEHAIESRVSSASHLHVGELNEASRVHNPAVSVGART